MSVLSWQALSESWLEIHHQAKLPERQYVISDLLLKANSKVLDVGCGLGNFTKIIIENNIKPQLIVGVDLSADHLKSAQKTIMELDYYYDNCYFIQGNLSNLPFKNMFDIAWCSNTLQYSLDPKRSIQEMARTLKNGGLLVIKEEDVARDILLSWDPEFEIAISHAWFKITQEMARTAYWDPFMARKLFGLFLDLKFENITVKTYLIERTAPLPEMVEQYIYRAFYGYKDLYRKYLSHKHWLVFQDLFDSQSNFFLFNRKDIHFLSTETIVCGYLKT